MYAVSQHLERPFCVPPFEDAAYSPPYCPAWSFHSVDELFWFRPKLEPVYNFTAADTAFSELLGSRFGALLADGGHYTVDCYISILLCLPLMTRERPANTEPGLRGGGFSMRKKRPRTARTEWSLRVKRTTQTLLTYEA